MSQDLDPRQTGIGHSYSPMEMARPSHIWRPQRWGKNAPNYLQGRQRHPNDALLDEITRPVVLREVAYGHQDQDTNRVYIMKPGEGRERGGTSRGGVFVCLPDQSINRYATPPPSKEPGALIEPEAYVVYGPNVWRAYGLPDLLRGSVQANGWREGIDPATGNYVLQVTTSPWRDAIRLDEPTEGFWVWGRPVPKIDDRIPPEIPIEDLSETDAWSAKQSWEQTRLWEAKPTGLFSGGAISINGSDQLVVDPGLGTVMNSYDSPNSTVTQVIVEFDGGTVAIAHPTERRSFVLIDSLGNIVQQVAVPTPTQRRDLILLGAIFTSIDGSHDTRAQPVVINYVSHGFHDFVVDVLNYFHIISGGKVAEESPLYLSMEASVIWSLNANWHVNKKDPHRITRPAQNPLLFGYVLGDGSIDSTAPEQFIDPATYDPGGAGVPTTVPQPGATATIQRLYMNAIGEYWILYGQNLYQNFLEAEASILVDETNTVIPDFLEHAIHLGWIVAEKNSADWAFDTAKFVPVGQGGSSGGGGSPAETFLDLTDTPSIYTGEGGNLVAVKSAEDGLEFVPNGTIWPDPLSHNADSTPNVTITSSTFIDANLSHTFNLPAGHRALVMVSYAMNALLNTGTSRYWIRPKVNDSLGLYYGQSSGKFIDESGGKQGSTTVQLFQQIPASGADRNVIVGAEYRRDPATGNFVSYLESISASILVIPG